LEFIKRNINGILGTIVFHLIIVIIAMASGIETKVQYQETYMLIEPQYLDEIEQEKEKTDAEAKYGDIDIEQYINEIRNVGSNYRGGASPEELQAMSQEKLKAMYEAEMLREKYGDDYEKMMNTSYEDYLKENNTPGNKTGQSDNSTNESYAGPALVFVELENPKRGKTYIEVPVFTCRHGGTVIINISIDTDGRVKSANIISVKSSGDGDCIGNAARNAALNSKFTTAAGGKLEYGKITYQFIQQ
jgi:TonB family protein